MNDRRSAFYISSGELNLYAVFERPVGAESYPLAIIFHGFTGNMEEKQIEKTAEAFVDKGIAALRVDLYGHGKSDGFFHDHNLFKWINNGLDVLNYVRGMDHISEICLCGHSQGGLLAMILAAMYPDLIRAIFLLSPAVMIPEDARLGRSFGLSFDPKKIPDEVFVYGHHLSGDYFRVAQLIDTDKVIDAYQGKVFIIHGDKDEAVDPQYAIRTAERYQDCRLQMISGADHEFTDHIQQLYRTIADAVDLLDEKTLYD